MRKYDFCKWNEETKKTEVFATIEAIHVYDAAYIFRKKYWLESYACIKDHNE